MGRKISYLLMACTALVALNSCVVDGSESGANATVKPQTETAFDPDATKATALGLIFGMSQIDDRLDYNAGDKEDWRYIIVPGSGMMSIKISIDKPKDIDGSWNIIDSEGRTLHQQTFSKNEGYYEFRDYPVKKGIYYFQMKATAGKSIYTIATSFTPSAPSYVPPPEPVVVEEEPEEEEEVVQPKSKPKKPRNSGKSSASKSDSESKPKGESKQAAASESGKKITGFISLLTPRPDGSAEATIRDAGKNKGIETGAIGKISGTSIKIEMTQCFATSCKATIPADANPASLKKGANVVFSVP